MKHEIALQIIKGLPKVPQAHGNSRAVWYKELAPHCRQMGSHAEGWPVAHSGNQSGSALVPSVVLGRTKLLSYSFTLLFAFIQVQ